MFKMLKWQPTLAGLALIIGVMLVGLGLPSVVNSQDDDGIDSIIEDYPNWTRLTAEARPVGPSLWMLCRLPTPKEQAFMDSVHGAYYLNDYVNDIGLAAMTTERYPRFPVGTVIVKEKLTSPTDTAPHALGIMIKHEDGYDPTTNDWAYWYWLAPDVLVRDNDNYCADCHREAALTDSVFRPYLSIEPAFKLYILAERWGFDVRLGYAFDTSQAILQDIALDAPLDIITEDDIETYDWAEQLITLTPEATVRLMESLNLTDEGSGYGANMALDNQIFVVELAGERLYGGIFTFGFSAKGLDFPVIYHQFEKGQLHLAIRPYQGGLTPGPDRSYQDMPLTPEHRARIEPEALATLFEMLQAEPN